MALRSISLRHVVPIAFLGSALALTVVSLLWRLASLDEEIEHRTAAEAQMLMQMVAGDVESSLRSGDPLHARAMIVRSSADRQLLGAALFGADDRVLFATTLTSVGDPIEETMFAPVRELLDPTRTGPGSHIRVSDDGASLFTLHPILLRREQSDLLPSEIGVLAMRHDLVRAKAEGRHRAVADELFGLLPVGLLGLLIAVFFHVHLTRRAQALVDATARVARGEYAIEPLAGRDELALISAAIARMAEEIERQRRREKLMVAELDHRVKNSLSMVLSLADETLAASDTLEGFSSDFEGRLRSLASAHEALAASRWEGVDLSDIVRRCLEPVAPKGDRLRLDGPPVVLSPESAAPLALALHELATNATKYGAFSREGGTVTIDWSEPSDGWVRLRWRERGGPAVHPPEHPGLGTTLIRGLIEQELGGRVTIDYRLDGVRCDIRLPFH